MDEFGPGADNDRRPVSIKIRAETSCFHREHSPEAYRLIDDYVTKLHFSKSDFKIEEHESGPEILVWIKGGVEFVKSLIELVVAIVKARSEGNKKGDQPSSSLEIIIRGFYKDGEYFEEKIIRIPPDHPIAEKMIKEALQKQLEESAQKKPGKRKKKPGPHS
jgi:hypothetical protein